VSRFRRFKERFFGRRARAGEPVAGPSGLPGEQGDVAREGQPAPRSPVEAARQRLEDAARSDAAVHGDALVAALDVLAQGAHEFEALHLGRRVLALHPMQADFALRLAGLASGRGDDVLANALLAPLVARADASTSALELAGEVAERRGDADAALAFYERALARDIDRPRTRERAARLREGRGPRGALEGATLLADGALARGRYRVLRELGRGGAGTVFAVRDLRTERVVALKLYHGRGPLERARLRGEARVAASLAHPGVVRVFDLDESLLSIAMEHIEAGSVRDALRRGPVPFARARRWLESACDTLAFVHAAGIVHRDLKPSNWLVRADDSVVLTDFGLARRIGERGSDSDGAGEGTLAYMPPEQREGAAAHPAADVHALGITLRELMARASDEVPAALSALADACTHAHPEARPSLGELRSALRTAAG
jgi:hypothetical protein